MADSAQAGVKNFGLPKLREGNVSWGKILGLRKLWLKCPY